jgi:hypothetical protein
MTRRLLSALAVLVLALTACSSPAAPALTDPKEILSQSVLSLKDVKTIDIKGSLTGSVTQEGMGTIPLDGTTLALAMDVIGKKVSFTLDAPSFMGTKVEAIVIDQTAWFRILGPLASFAGGDTTGKFTKSDIGDTGSDTPADPAQLQKSVDELKAALDKLPSAPTKEADERCGDTDCYHVKFSLTSEQIAQMGASEAGAVPGSFTFDYWARKNDLRPAKIALGVDAEAQGSLTATFDITYDGTITVNEPPADQVAP